jgi:isopentenyl diphosphate isomerase/L-lactate dehydrogenase-like FMN-dependent dehydrogenase
LIKLTKKQIEIAMFACGTKNLKELDEIKLVDVGKE